MARDREWDVDAGAHVGVGGELVRAFRERSKLSQEELAALAGVTDRTIRNVESGTRRPRRDTLERLAEVLRLADVDRAALLEAWSGDRPPGSLPPDVPDFVGRTSTLDTAHQILRGPAATGVSRVCVLAGMGGLGKTTLAVHLAHELADRYPDGQLYLQLRGTSSDPVEPAEALARLLCRLGLPAGHLPADVDTRAELLRDRLRSRQVLLVLDDAATEAQVRPLLPATPSCAVLVTSRSRLSGLAGARLVELAAFDPAEALALLSGVIGEERVAAEEAAARAVVDLCGWLPLAVRIVAALLAGRPGWRIGHVVGLLADERDRLSVLAAGDLQVKAGIALSYLALPDDVRRAFRLLSVIDVPDFAAWTASAGLGVDLQSARRLLERLVDGYLLDIVGTDEAGQPRYRFHDLVRVYARHEGPERPDPAARAAVVAGASRAALTLVERAGGNPLIDNLASELLTMDRWPVEEQLAREVMAAPLTWLDAEHTAIAAIARQAAGTGGELLGTAADLTAAMSWYCSLRCEFTGWQGMAEAVIRASDGTGPPAAEAVARLALGDGLAEQGELTGARPFVLAALDTARARGLHRLAAHALLSLAIIERSTGNVPAAAGHMLAAIDAAGLAGDRVARGYAESELGAVHVSRGEFDLAEERYRTARSVFRDRGEARGETKVVLRLAILDQARGELGRAGDGFREALKLAGSCDDLRAEIEILYRLGVLHLAGGELDVAAELLGQAVASSQEIGDARGTAMASDSLGQVHARRGDDAAARAAYDVALAYYQRMPMESRAREVRTRLAALAGA